MVGWHHPFNGHELGQTSGDGEGQRTLVCRCPSDHGVGHDLVTEQQQRLEGLPSGSVLKNLPANARRCRRCQFDSWAREILWRRRWQPASGFQSGKFHGKRSLVGYSPRGHKESDTTERLIRSSDGCLKNINIQYSVVLSLLNIKNWRLGRQR